MSKLLISDYSCAPIVDFILFALRTRTEVHCRLIKVAKTVANQFCNPCFCFAKGFKWFADGWT